MRISSQQLLNASIPAIQDQSVEAMKWQDQISSGKRYNAAYQGMVALARGIEIAFDQSKFKMLKANQDFVATRMAMADARERLQRPRRGPRPGHRAAEKPGLAHRPRPAPRPPGHGRIRSRHAIVLR